MMASLQTRPYALHCGEGPSLQSMGASISIKASSEQTGGAFNVFEVICPPDYATPLHIHYAEDVAIYILEGALTIFWGSEKKEAAAGFYFFQPIGIPHGFRVEGDKPARFLLITFPAGFDRFVIELEPSLPSLEAATLGARYKIEILGPLPE